MEEFDHTEGLMLALQRVSDFAKSVTSQRDLAVSVKKALHKADLIKQYNRDATVPWVVEGVDSSFTVYRTLSMQVIAVATVAFSETKVRKLANAIPSLLSDYSDDLARGLGTMYELALARSSTSDLVLLDGSFSSFAVGLGMFYYSLCESDDPAVKAVMEYVNQDSEDPLNMFKVAGSKTFVEDVIIQVSNPRAVALPKASGSQGAVQHLVSTLDIDKKLGATLLKNYTDRSLFTLLLEPGEYFVFHSAKVHGREKSNANCDFEWPWLAEIFDFLSDSGKYSGSGGVTVALYRPHPWSPAFKVEIPGRPDKSYIEAVLSRLTASVVSPSIKEHLEQYMADLQAKDLLKATVDLSATTLISSIPPEDIDVSLLLSYYRTESDLGVMKPRENQKRF